jgi:hypothetical protein
MIAKRLATIVAALLAVTGCGGTAEARRTEPAAIVPSSASGGGAISREVHAIPEAQTGVKNVPAAFSLPPGSRVTNLSDRESGASFTLTAPDPQTVLSFYRRQLPLGAFTIVADRAELDTTSLAFRDQNGWAGAIYATEHRVTVAVKRA